MSFLYIRFTLTVYLFSRLSLLVKLIKNEGALDKTTEIKIHKLLLVVDKAVNSLAPLYISELLVDCNPTESLK